MNLTAIFVVASGSALGGVFRLLASTVVQTRVGTLIPAGTLFVNIAGSFVLGVIARYWTANPDASTTMRLFLATGFCGGFTTFSTFSLENLELLQKGEVSKAISYMVLSVLLSLAAVGVGYSLARSNG